MKEHHSTHSVLRERIVEHVFVGEVLRALWRHRIFDIEVLRSEFDAHGYDVVMVRGELVRHVQLKTGTAPKPADVSLSLALAAKPSGCAIWIHVTDDLEMGPFFWFGGPPGRPLPAIDSYAAPRRPTHNSQGVRPERSNHRVVSKKLFEEIPTLDAVLVKLFGELNVKPETPSVYATRVCAGAELTRPERERCCHVIACGDAVDPASAARKLPAAPAVAMATTGEEIVGVGVIKPVDAGRNARVSRDSGFDLPRDMPEMGYVAVDCDHRRRGLARRLVADLLAGRVERLYATTQSDGMKRTLAAVGFTLRGRSWRSQRDGGELTLWVRD